MSDHTYIGRFAPSPTGLLHIGSLYTAVASFIDARAHQGQWLVRMDDIDPPREVPGAADQILRTLEHYGLHWDGEVWYQSQRSEYYEATVQTLLQQEQAYYCTCSRRQIQDSVSSNPNLSPNNYPGTCRGRQQRPQQAHAIRLRTQDRVIRLHDGIQGMQTLNLSSSGGDFVIKRKDGLYAYHLATTLDDHAQGITDVVRGSDLLPATFCHLYLQECLQLSVPNYSHLPVLVNEQGQKLSKQTYAEPLSTDNPSAQLLYCLQRLGQNPPNALAKEPVSTILQWGIQHWQRERIPHFASLRYLK